MTKRSRSNYSSRAGLQSSRDKLRHEIRQKGQRAKFEARMHDQVNTSIPSKAINVRDLTLMALLSLLKPVNATSNKAQPNQEQEFEFDRNFELSPLQSDSEHPIDVTLTNKVSYLDSSSYNHRHTVSTTPLLSNSTTKEEDSPLFPNTSPLSWTGGTIAIPALLTMVGLYHRIYRHFCRRPRSYQTLQEVELPRIAILLPEENSMTPHAKIDLSQIKISEEEIQAIVKKIISNSQQETLDDTNILETQKRSKVLFTMALVWDKEAGSFYQLKNDAATHDTITKKLPEYIAGLRAKYQDFIFFKDSAEAVELYLAISKAIKSHQQQAPKAVKAISNIFSTLYIAGCMFSVFAGVYSNSPKFMLRNPWLITPVAELMVGANGIANYLFCFNKTQITLAQMLAKISKPHLPSNLGAKSLAWYIGSKSLIVAKVAGGIAAGFFASNINLSLPFIAGFNLPKDWHNIYGGFNQRGAVLSSEIFGTACAIGTMPPISLLYGIDAYNLGGKIYNALHKSYQGGIKDTLYNIKESLSQNPSLYLSHFILSAIGLVRTIKFYQIMKERNKEIFQENKWPEGITDPLALLAVLASTPLVFNSMIAASNRLYNFITTRNIVRYNSQELLMFGIVMLNAAANSFLAMENIKNLETTPERMWEAASNIATGVSSLAICMKYMREFLDEKTIDQIKIWAQTEEQQNTGSMNSLHKRLEAAQDKVTQKVTHTLQRISPRFSPRVPPRNPQPLDIENGTSL